MALEDHFAGQVDAIRDFMAEPGTSLASLRYDADADVMITRILSGLHDEDSPHSMIFCDTAFASEAQFCQQALELVVANNEEARDDLKAQAVDLPPAPQRSDKGALAAYLCAVRECLPEPVGGYVIVIDPESVADADGFAACMAYLAEHVTTEGAKLLVLEANEHLRLEGLEERCARARLLEINFGPEGVERQLRKDLSDNELSPTERGKYLGMAGAYDAARQDWEAAIAAQTESVELLAEHGEPADQANALYSLGTTHLRAKQPEQSEAALAEALQVCLANGQDALLAMVLTNLGVALQALERVEESLQSLDAAAATFDGLGHLPGKAFALDTKAATLRLEERNEEAERAWLDALAVYDGIESEQFSELREAGRKDLREKLRAFYNATDQPAKVAALQTGA